MTKIFQYDHKFFSNVMWTVKLLIIIVVVILVYNNTHFCFELTLLCKIVESTSWNSPLRPIYEMVVVSAPKLLGKYSDKHCTLENLGTLKQKD